MYTNDKFEKFSELPNEDKFNVVDQSSSIEMLKKFREVSHTTKSAAERSLLKRKVKMLANLPIKNISEEIKKFSYSFTDSMISSISKELAEKLYNYDDFKAIDLMDKLPKNLPSEEKNFYQEVLKEYKSLLPD